MLRPEGQGLRASAAPPFQEALLTPLYAFLHTCVPHLCLCSLPICALWRGSGEDSDKCLNKELGKGRDGSLHNLSEGGKTEPSVFGPGHHAFP